MRRNVLFVARRVVWGVVAFAAIACGEPQTEALLIELGQAQGSDARLYSMLRREVSRPPEIAALLFEMHAVAERLAHLGSVRATESAVATFARDSLGELKSLHEGMVLNCTSSRAESTYFELAALRGQDVLADLRRGETHFDRRYLFGVATLGVEFAEMLERSVEPRAAAGEARELANLRSLLLKQAVRAETLLEPPSADIQ